MNTTKERLSEIALLAIHGMIMDDYDSAIEYLATEVKLTEEECNVFQVDYEDLKKWRNE